MPNVPLIDACVNILAIHADTLARAASGSLPDKCDLLGDPLPVEHQVQSALYGMRMTIQHLEEALK